MTENVSYNVYHIVKLALAGVRKKAGPKAPAYYASGLRRSRVPADGDCQFAAVVRSPYLRPRFQA